LCRQHSRFVPVYVLADMLLPRRIPAAPAAAAAAARAFSASAPALRGVTSNVGKRPIPIPEGITYSTSPSSISITGPRGSTAVALQPYMTLSTPAPGVLALAVADATAKAQRQMWGLTRTLIANALAGMTEGFGVPLHLVGVGYRAALEPDPRGTEDGGSGRRLHLRLGYSHSVFVPVPAHIEAEVPAPTQILLRCNDKHLLGLFAAKVREWRKPEPYKGKVCAGAFSYEHSSDVSAIFRVSSSATSKSASRP
jgi:large subunit ribosomal protein L6